MYLSPEGGKPALPSACSVTADEESPTSGKVESVSQGTTGGEAPLEPATTAERGALSRLQSTVAHSKVSPGGGWRVVGGGTRGLPWQLLTPFFSVSLVVPRRCPDGQACCICLLGCTALPEQAGIQAFSFLWI